MPETHIRDGSFSTIVVILATMNIGLCGSHRTGKTTLAEAISVKTGMPFVRTNTSGVFRKCGIDPAEAFDLNKRLWIQDKILKAAEIMWDAEHKQFITDRTPLDMAAYTLGDILGSTEVNFIELEGYLSRCIEATNKFFRQLVLVQPGIPLVHEEGKAALNEGYLEHLNFLVLGLCNDERIKSDLLCIPRHMKSIEDRAALILTTLDNRGAN